MADVAAAAAEVVHEQVDVPQRQFDRPGDRAAAKAARREGAIAKLQASRGAADGDKPVTPAAQEPPPAQVAKAAPAVAAPAAKPDVKAEPKADDIDPQAERGLRAVEQAKKKWMDERAAEDAKREAAFRVREAEIARMHKEAEGKVGSISELKKLRAIEILDQLELNEDDYDEVARASYARTKAGKIDPRAQAAAQEAARSSATRAQAGTVSELREQIAELEKKFLGEFTKRDQQTFAERWVGEAVKAAPGDKPTFLGKLLANEPDTARRELLLIGAELEKANDGEAPTHAEVIAEFEARKRAQLKSLGLDPDALLAPPAPAAKPAPKTLDVTSRSITRPENAPKTREEKREFAIANLRARHRTLAEST